MYQDDQDLKEVFCDQSFQEYLITKMTLVSDYDLKVLDAFSLEYSL